MVFNTLTLEGKKSNIIKGLSLTSSDFAVKKLYEETEGRLVEFLVENDDLLCLVRPDNEESHYLKYLKIGANYTSKLMWSIPVPNKFVGHFQTVNYLANKMMPNCNTLYTIINTSKGPLIHEYNDVIPLNEKEGE